VLAVALTVAVVDRSSKMPMGQRVESSRLLPIR
jgi:hypothetical protein